MINDYTIHQKCLIYFKKIFYIFRNLKIKNEPSPPSLPKPSIQTFPKVFLPNDAKVLTSCLVAFIFLRCILFSIPKKTSNK